MSLTTAQLATLKADILADPTLNAFPANSDGAFAIAELYNKQFTPTFTVWRSNVTIAATGQAFNGTELGGLTTANSTRLQVIAQYLVNGYNAALPDVRQFFTDVFSGAGGTNTRANLALIWVRAASRVEKLFATGTGSVASPATLVFEGNLSYQDVLNARG